MPESLLKFVAGTGGISNLVIDGLPDFNTLPEIALRKEGSHFRFFVNPL